MSCNGAFLAGGFLTALVTLPTPASAAGRLYLRVAANDLPYETRLSWVDGAVMVYVPAGRFSMGAGPADSLAEADEKPQHEVALDAYWIGRTEVTNAQFERFLAAESSYATSRRRAAPTAGSTPGAMPRRAHQHATAIRA